MGIFAVFTLSLSTLIVTASDVQVPQPSEDALVKAKKEVRELFASDLSKAKSPTDKAKLAKDFLVTANKTIDDEVGRLVLLTLSRDLAIEGKDRKTALDAVSAIVERYQPAQGEPTDSKGQVDKAQKLWKEAEKEKASSVEQIRLQIHAAEWYTRAESKATGITRQLCEKRLGELAGEEKDGHHRSVNLLTKIVIPTSIINGKWSKDNNEVILERQRGTSRLYVMCPCQEYECEMSFVRTDGNDLVLLYLPVGSSHVMLQLYNRGKRFPCGLGLIKNKAPQDNNGATFLADVQNGKEHNVRAVVRKVPKTRSDYDVTVHYDGNNAVVHWQGNQSDLSLQKDWVIPGKGTFGIGGLDSRVVFRKFSVLIND